MYTPGHFDRQGNPCTQVEVRGLDGRNHALDDVVIDTGFSGFLQMPKSLAAAIRLEVGPMVELTLADNRKIAMETAYGTVDFQRYSRRGVIMLSETLPSPEFSPLSRPASRPGVRPARSGPKSVSGNTVEARDAAGGRPGATLRAALSGRQGASRRLPDVPASRRAPLLPCRPDSAAQAMSGVRIPG